LNVALNTTITEELEQEGLVREVIRVIQDYRKKLDLPIEKRVRLSLDVDDYLQEALVRFDHVLRESVLVSDVVFAKEKAMESFSIGTQSVR
ncbi:DUF5915 domain-containing protein, partial [Bacillus sp. SIMBA_074]